MIGVALGTNGKGNRMRFGIFYEHQLPRPWGERDEQTLLSNALDQVELADRIGIDYVWEVEHHFLEEYSHSSAPEVFLAAASQRTSTIRLGHGIVQVPPPVNHPARVAERVATLDLVSGGRVEFGTGEASSASELGGFGVARDAKRDMWHESVDAVTRMFVEEPFAGADGEFVRMPPRNVVPKPAQWPHPPLWVACSRRDTIHLAARNGMGALSFSFVEPEDAAQWVREYYELIDSPECVPAGFAVNPNVAVVLPMMLARDESEAIERGIDGAHFFGYSLAHYYGMTHHAGGTDIWQEFQQRRGETGFARHIVTANDAPLGVRLLQEGLGSLRGAIGTPEQVTELLRRYEAAGVDQVIFVLQAGPNRHEHICESLELFGSEVLPRFTEGREERERAKAEQLAPAIDAALDRREPARAVPAPYAIDEQAELVRARRIQRPTVRELAGQAGERARDTLAGQVRAAFAGFLRSASPDRVERYFESPAVQRALLAATVASFRPDLAGGFEGSVAYELDGRGGTRRWTIDIHGGRARVRSPRGGVASQDGRPGSGDAPAVVVSMPARVFARMAAGTDSPLALFLEGDVTVDGDFHLATRLGEMFGGASPY